uniref:LAGLIDADG homing endonuclease n=1 Tax=Ditylenchus dipsaci TaxID=166011 RepID=A0A915E0D4_9BILA
MQSQGGKRPAETEKILQGGEQLDATNLVRMIDIFVESWAITAYQGKRRSKESLKKLHAFIEKNSIQISSKNTHLKRILASVSDEQVSK